MPYADSSSSTIKICEVDARLSLELGKHFYALERCMRYTQANILWGTLALSKPSLLPDGSSLYALDLPRPVYLSGARLSAGFSEGLYTGRVTLHLSDASYTPVVKPAERWASSGILPFHNIENCLAFTTTTPAAAKSACTVTLRLENLRYFSSDDPSRACPTLESQILGTLTRYRDQAASYFTSLLNPEDSPQQAQPASAGSAWASYS